MKKLIATSILFLVSCKHGATFNSSVQEIEKQKTAISAITTLDLTSQSQYSALTDYFRNVTDLALMLKTDPKAKKALEAELKRTKLTDFCSKYILTTTEWQNLNGQCTVNGLYLCPDEVRKYPAIIKVIEDNSPTSLQKSFQADAECSKWKNINL